MQLNEIGSGHGSDAHHVTNCMHNHAHFDKVGKMGAAASSSGMGVQSMMAAESQADAQFSLAAWLDKTLNGGRKLWGSIWGNSDVAGTAETGRESGSEQVAGQASAVLQQDTSRSGSQALHTPQIAAAATAVLQPQDIHNNPYFSAVERLDDRRGNLWRRARVKLKNMAGQLTGRFPGKFLSAQTGTSSQAGQGSPKEDLRKQSKFRSDELTIDCVLTDDSYLLDSYDRKGEYSKLSTKK